MLGCISLVPAPQSLSISLGSSSNRKLWWFHFHALWDDSVILMRHICQPKDAYLQEHVHYWFNQERTWQPHVVHTCSQVDLLSLEIEILPTVKFCMDPKMKLDWKLFKSLSPQTHHVIRVPKLVLEITTGMHTTNMLSLSVNIMKLKRIIYGSRQSNQMRIIQVKKSSGANGSNMLYSLHLDFKICQWTTPFSKRKEWCCYIKLNFINNLLIYLLYFTSIIPLKFCDLLSMTPLFLLSI